MSLKARKQNLDFLTSANSHLFLFFRDGHFFSKEKNIRGHWSALFLMLSSNFVFL